ncbi:hypothetical protein BD410DRAFT_858454 [Rickenella mellea]|uniref:Uncharacterized protein n=1 Tax=Rickenella mellea TaxID=50990 RepID=A0A4Y7Q6M0_9AGAM|nr:hypothetical protein BD410DRAFT_858454 [Rickenella mellea]
MLGGLSYDGVGMLNHRTLCHKVMITQRREAIRRRQPPASIVPVLDLETQRSVLLIEFPAAEEGMEETKKFTIFGPERRGNHQRRAARNSEGERQEVKSLSDEFRDHRRGAPPRNSAIKAAIPFGDLFLLSINSEALATNPDAASINPEL